jgi:CMP-N,N'-diacetyllegionaminic acid synthase
MKTLGVILARAGSVGLTGKHLRLLQGRPVIEYTFDHAFDSALLDQVVVSTDCPGVARLARTYQLPVVDRPAELATSDASVQDVLIHAVRSIGESFDAVVCLYGNVPVRPAGLIDSAIAHLRETNCDSVRSFCPVGKWHPAWMSTLAGDTVNRLQAGSIHRRQDLAPLFLHDGGVLACTRSSLWRGVATPTDPHAFFGTDLRAVRTEPGDVVEIDHPRDLYWAEAVLRDRSHSNVRLAG